MASYNQYETIGAPCIQTKIRRNFGPIYYFRGPKLNFFTQALCLKTIDAGYQILDAEYQPGPSIQHPVSSVSDLFAIFRRISTLDDFLMINDEV
ncbi:MAG: hypothetical protein U9Q05_10505, partial [Thermodesulfobacteriota bacterium]|nr:hypothetical protein [Thermodesulfobacteriota bacterium]